MAAVGGNNNVGYIYTGAEGEVIPREATHIIVLAKIIPANAFRRHPNISEVLCLDVKKIEKYAFYWCPNLRRVRMCGVKILADAVFCGCEALTDVECGKLEIIGKGAFYDCKSLRSINLLSARIVQAKAFAFCDVLSNVKFGSKLERIEGAVFGYCTALERITIPMKDGVISRCDIFFRCQNLRHVDLVEGELHETIAALQLFTEWRDDMNEEIDSINQILPNASAGKWDEERTFDAGRKAQAIRSWIKSVLGKIDHYKAELVGVAVTTLQLDLPQDLVRSNIFPFLALPSHILDGKNHQVVVGDGDEERVDEHEGNEVGRGNHLEEDGQEDVEERDSDREENEVSPTGIILIEILLFYWLIVWGTFSLMRGMPFASPVLVSALVTWQVQK